jgi:hypothetical protein
VHAERNDGGRCGFRTRAFVASRHFSWLTPRRLRALTIVLLTAALLVSATLVSGTAPGSGQQAAGKSPSADRRR